MYNNNYPIRYSGNNVPRPIYEATIVNEATAPRVQQDPANDYRFLEEVFHARGTLHASWRGQVTTDEMYNNIFNPYNQVQGNTIDVPPDLKSSINYLLQNTTHTYDGILIQVLTCVSMATCGRVTIHCDDTWQESTALWTVQSNESGTRKSACVAALRNPIETFMQEKNKNVDIVKIHNECTAIAEKELKNIMRRKLKDIFRKNEHSPENSEIIKSITARYTEDMLNLKKDKGVDGLHNEVELLIDDCTQLGLCERLQTQGESCGCITAEDTFLTKILLQKSNSPNFLNKLYGQESHNYGTKRENFSLQNPAFSMVNFIQHSVFEKIFCDKELNSLGITARILPYIHFNRPHNMEFIDTMPTMEGYNRTITRLLQQFYTQESDAPRHTAHLSPEAYKAVKGYEHYLKQYNQDTHAAYRKLHGQAVRLAWAFHAWSNEDPCLSDISLKDMQRGIAVCCNIERVLDFMYSSGGLATRSDAKLVFQKVIDMYISKGGTWENIHWLPFNGIKLITGLNTNRLALALDFLDDHNALRAITLGSNKTAIVFHPSITSSGCY